MAGALRREVRLTLKPIHMKVLRKDQLQIVLQILITALLLRFALFKQVATEIALTDVQFLLYLLSIGLIGSGGLVLYGIVVQEEQPWKKIYKDIEKAYYLYLGINILGIGISFFVSSAIDKTAYFGFYMGGAAIIYLYTTQWRKIILLNNIIFALLVSFTCFLEIITDLMPTLNPLANSATDKNHLLFEITINLGILLFLLYFIKTILLDLKFVQLDKRNNKKTLATLHGRKKGSIRTTILALVPLLLLMAFCVYYYPHLQWISLYVAIAIILPFIYMLFKLWHSKSTKDYTFVNNILTIIIWLTIFSIVVLLFNLK